MKRNSMVGEIVDLRLPGNTKIPTKQNADNTIVTKLREKSSSKNNSNLIWFDVKTPTRFYKGRDKEMREIENCWEESLREMNLMFVAITGLGGIGKSELAKNFAKKFYIEMQGHCIWINAETTQTISDSFRRLSLKLKISLKDLTGNDKTLENLAIEVLQKLSGEKCVLIFDNLESYKEKIFNYFAEYSTKLLATKIKPFVLLTSRFQSVKQNFGFSARHLLLDVLTEEAAVEFFVEALINSQQSEDINTQVKLICEKLMCFPLAMQQAVAYINANPEKILAHKIQSYLKLFEMETKKLLDFPIPKLQTPVDFSRTTYITWQITLDKIGKIPGVGSKAKAAMNILSFLHSDNIDSSLVEQILKAVIFTKFKVMENAYSAPPVDIFEILNEYSMCQLKTADNNNICISVHRLVQQIIRIRLDEEKETMSVLDVMLQEINDLLKADNIHSSQMIHVDSLWKHAGNKPTLAEKYNDFTENIFYVHDKAGRLREAYNSCCNAIIHLESLYGDENRRTLSMLYLKGVTQEQLREYDEALWTLDPVYEKQKQLFGETDDHCLSTAGHIGLVFQYLGNYELALKWLTQTLNFRQSLSDEYDGSKLALLNNLAFSLKNQGKNVEAQEIYEKILPIQENILGDENPVTLATKQNIGNLILDQGDPKKALMVLEPVWAIRKTLLGPEHPHTLITANNIAGAKLDLGEYEGAEKIFEQLHFFRSKLLGRDHPAIFIINSRLAFVKMRQGKYEDALSIWRENLAMQEREFGEEYLDALTTKNNIGYTLTKQGKFDEAIDILTLALEIQERVFGAKHFLTLKLKQNIANVWIGQGNYESALVLHNEVLTIRIETFGQQHIHTFTSKYDIAGLLASQGNYDDSLKLYTEVFEGRQRVLGKEHPDTKDAFSCIERITTVAMHDHRKISPFDLNLNNTKSRCTDRAQTIRQRKNRFKCLIT